MASGVYWRNPATNAHSDPSKLFAFSLTQSNVKKLKGFTPRSQELTIPQKKRRWTLKTTPSFSKMWIKSIKSVHWVIGRRHRLNYMVVILCCGSQHGVHSIWGNAQETACDSGDSGSTPGSGRSPGGGHGNPPSILTWRIPWVEEPGGLQSMGSQRVGHDWSDLASHLMGFSIYTKKKRSEFTFSLPHEESPARRPSARQEESPHQEPGQLALWPQMSILRINEKISVYCLSHLVCSILLKQVELIETPYNSQHKPIVLPQ